MKLSKTESDLESLQKASKLRDNNKQTFAHDNQSFQQVHKISKTKSNRKKDCITRSCISQ